MYRRDGFERDTASVQQRSLVLVKTFKTPSNAAPPREQPTRKRKRVSYKENADDNDGNNSESDGQRKKRKKFDEYTPLAELTVNINNSFPVYEPKPRQHVFTQRFAIPAMRNKDGSTVKLPTSNVSLGIRPPIQILPRPLHDPMADHAVVLYDPTIDDRETDEERLERLKEEAKEKARKEAEAKVVGMHNPHKSLRDLLGGSKKKVSKRVPVVIDPVLSKILRPHQVEGVRVSLPVLEHLHSPSLYHQFLYRCTSGMVVENQYGCIMADGMGLGTSKRPPRDLYLLATAGKTLQTISLIWTLLKQSPHASKPTIEKCIIACPSSLVRNWANELDKWLGKGAVGVFALDGRSSKAETITNLRRWINAKGRNVTLPVMIVSYETLRTLATELANCEIGLLVCDEGHRLKNGESLTFTTLTSLKVQRRVILSGTPIQNDLSEYFSLLNFANPNFLGSKADFRKNFENTIIRGRDADATDVVKEESEKKLKELGGLVAPFIIRRTNELLSKYREPLRF